MNIFKKFTLILPLILGFNAINSADFESNVSITNDYIWRGMTQSSGEPAISGGFDISGETGLYFGTWGSSIEFGGDTAAMELDYYFGYANELESGVSYDIGYLAFTYPGDDGADFEEVYLGLGYGLFGATYSIGQDDASDNIEFSLAVGETGIGLTYGDYEDAGKYTTLSYDFPQSVAGLGISIAWSDFSSEEANGDQDGFYITFSK